MLSKIIWILYTRYNSFLITFRRIYYKKVLKKCWENLQINNRSTISFPQNVEIGDNLFIAVNVSLNGHWGLTIWNKVLIARDVNIWTSNHIFSSIEIPIADQWYTVNPVSIGDDVWIGSNVVVLPWVHIWKGVVIGAWSIVTKSIPDYAIAVWNPAKVIKYRN